MANLKFLLSNPPHGDVDPARAASIFGLTAAEARIKLNFPGADVWFANEAGSDMSERIQELSDAGARVTVTSGQAIASLSERFEARGFAFRDDAMELRMVRDGPIRIPYSWRVHVVICRPVGQEQRGPRMTVRQAAKAANPNRSARQEARRSIARMKAPLDPSFVDLYFTSGTTVMRATMWAGRVEFSGLGERKKLTERHNADALVDVLCERFPDCYEDRRLENAPAPRITLLGGRTLRAHLEVVDASLKDIDEHDLLSRLSFLSVRGG